MQRQLSERYVGYPDCHSGWWRLIRGVEWRVHKQQLGLHFVIAKRHDSDCKLQLNSGRLRSNLHSGRPDRYSVSVSNFPSVGLCFSGFFFFSKTTFPAGGAPTRSRANSLTAVTARNRFVFFWRAI